MVWVTVILPCVSWACEKTKKKKKKKQEIRKEAFFQEEKESKFRPHMFLGQPSTHLARREMRQPRRPTRAAARPTSVEAAIYSCRFYFHSWNIKQVKTSSWMQLLLRVLHLRCEGHTRVGETRIVLLFCGSVSCFQIEWETWETTLMLDSGAPFGLSGLMHFTLWTLRRLNHHTMRSKSGLWLGLGLSMVNPQTLIGEFCIHFCSILHMLSNVPQSPSNFNLITGWIINNIRKNDINPQNDRCWEGTKMK